MSDQAQEKMFECDTPEKCRIVQNGPTMTTLIYNPPVYDGYGHILNNNTNKSYTNYKCTVCGKEFKK